MSIEDKKDKINSKLNTLYYDLISCNTKEDFQKKMEEKFNQQAKNYTNLLKEEQVKDYYNSKIKKLAEKFENDKNKDILQDTEIIKKKLEMKYNSTLKSKDEEAFKESYNTYKDELLKNYENEDKKAKLKKYIEDWINIKVEDFKQDKDKEKKDYILNFVNQSYNDLKSISNSEDDFKNGIEEKKNNDNLLVEYLKDEIYKKYYEKNLNDKLLTFRRELKIRNTSKKQDLKKKLNDFFNTEYEKIVKVSSNENEYLEKLKLDEELHNNYNELKDDYDMLLKNKIKLFKIDLAEKAKKNLSDKAIIEDKFKKFFDFHYEDVLKTSNNEEDFKSEYEKKRKLNSEIENYFNDYKDYYNELLEDKKKSFQADCLTRQNKKLTEIENLFFKFFNDNFENICKSSSKEDDFKSEFEKKRKSHTEVNKYFENGYSSNYNTLLEQNVAKFKNYLKDKEKNEETLMKNNYLKFFDFNYVKVATASSNENMFRSEYKKKLENNAELKKNLKDYQNYYDECLENKVSQFKMELKNKIGTLYFQNYDTAIGLSKNEADFEIHMQELLNLPDLLKIEEYKEHLNTLYNKNKINTDLSNKKSREKQSLILETNTFFDQNYDEIKNKSKDKNAFESEIKKIASTQVKNSENFKVLLTKYTIQFEREKEEEKEKENKKEKLKKYKELESKIINDFMKGINEKEFEDIGSIEYFRKFNQKKFDEILQKLFIEENYDDKIDNKIDSYINELLNDKNTKVNHLNILLCGNSGAGKSTLINGFLELEGGNKLATGTGEAVTMETKYISSPKFPIFRLGDSRGTEISKTGPESYGIGEVVKNMNEFIQYQLDTKNPDNYVHCIWYCVIPLDGRFNKVIDECLKELESNYKIRGLPIIIVGTKGISKEANKCLEDYLKKTNVKYPFHPVLAQKFDDKEPYGLEQLRLMSLEKAIEGIESSSYQGIIKNITETSKLKVEEQKKIIDEKINQKKEEVFKSIESNPNFNTLKKFLKETFIIILNQYSSINLSNKNSKIEEIKLGEKSKNEIDKFIDDYYSFCKDYYDKNYEQIINTRTFELMDKIKKEKTDFIQSNLVFVETKSKDDLKNEIEGKIKEKLKKKSDIYYFKNLYNELINLLTKTFKNYFIKYFNDTIKDKENEDETKNLIISKISSQFKELKLKIEEYNKNILNEKRKKEEANGSSQEANDFFAQKKKNKKKQIQKNN